MTNKTKTIILVAIGFLVMLSACDRKSFVKKIVGTWSVSKYLFSGQDKTIMYDTTLRDWKLTIGEDLVYTKTWKDYFFAADSIIYSDTLGYDSITSTYTILMDTFRFMDTTIVPRMRIGKWDLINSEEDLQLRDDSDNATEIYRILDLTKNNLNLRKGNEEFYLGK